MSFHLRCPTEGTVAASLAAAQHQSLTYQPIGLALAPRVGYWTDDAGAVIGQGDAAFACARRALEQWQQFDLGWTQVFPKRAAIVEGTVVVVRVRHLRFWSLNPCRIVSTRETAHEFSFAYGTLPTHAESGEEIFKVTIDAATGDVRYDIRAVSRAHALLAKLGGPVTRGWQARFRDHSIAAMRRAIVNDKAHLHG